METIYKTEGDKHVSLLEDDFMPVEENQIDRKKVIEQLKGLKEHCEDFKGEEPWDSDVQALDYAIQELKGTAQEVPVREQHRFVPEDSNGKYPNSKKCSNS